MKPDREFFKIDLFGASVTAIFSPCMKYQYILQKTWDDKKPHVIFIGLNPSTATHEKPDNTITKVNKIARNNGFGGFYMMNLFAYISPNPKDLLTVADPLRENNHYLRTWGGDAKTVVFCWGAFKEAQQRAEEVKRMFPIAYALHINNDGSPKHPLYCKDDTNFVEWSSKK